VRRSAPVAATRAMHTAICVSSLYSPGAYGPSPPPSMAGRSSAARPRRPNSYGTPSASPQAATSSVPAARSPRPCRTPTGAAPLIASLGAPDRPRGRWPPPRRPRTAPPLDDSGRPAGRTRRRPRRRVPPAGGEPVGGDAAAAAHLGARRAPAHPGATDCERSGHRSLPGDLTNDKYRLSLVSITAGERLGQHLCQWFVSPLFGSPGPHRANPRLQIEEPRYFRLSFRIEFRL